MTIKNSISLVLWSKSPPVLQSFLHKPSGPKVLQFSCLKFTQPSGPKFSSSPVLNSHNPLDLWPKSPPVLLS